MYAVLKQEKNNWVEVARQPDYENAMLEINRQKQHKNLWQVLFPFIFKTNNKYKLKYIVE